MVGNWVYYLYSFDAVLRRKSDFCLTFYTDCRFSFKVWNIAKPACKGLAASRLEDIGYE